MISLLRIAAQLVNDCNEEAQHDKGTRRQHKEQDVVGLRQQRQSKDGARAQQFTTDSQQRQTQRKAKADTNTIEQ